MTSKKAPASLMVTFGHHELDVHDAIVKFCESSGATKSAVVKRILAEALMGQTSFASRMRAFPTPAPLTGLRINKASA